MITFDPFNDNFGLGDLKGNEEIEISDFNDDESNTFLTQTSKEPEKMKNILIFLLILLFMIR
jgi:hypothetical protein